MASAASATRCGMDSEHAGPTPLRGRRQRAQAGNLLRFTTKSRTKKSFAKFLRRRDRDDRSPATRRHPRRESLVRRQLGPVGQQRHRRQNTKANHSRFDACRRSGIWNSSIAAAESASETAALALDARRHAAQAEVGRARAVLRRRARRRTNASTCSACPRSKWKPPRTDVSRLTIWTARHRMVRQFRRAGTRPWPGAGPGGPGWRPDGPPPEGPRRIDSIPIAAAPVPKGHPAPTAAVATVRHPIAHRYQARANRRRRIRSRKNPSRRNGGKAQRTACGLAFYLLFATYR